MSHLEKLCVEKDLIENMCKKLVEKQPEQPTDRDLWLLHQYTGYLSTLNMTMDEEMYKKAYVDALENRTRQLNSRLEFMNRVKKDAQIVKRAQRKFDKREKELSHNIDTLLDSTCVVDVCDSRLDELFNDSKYLSDECKIDGISEVLLPKHVGVWDKTKESYKKLIHSGNTTDGPKSDILSNMIESGQITLPSAPEDSLC